MPRMSTSTPTYFREVRKEGIVLKFNHATTRAQRMENASKLSVLLLRPGLLTLKEQESIGYFQMPPGVVHWVEFSPKLRICVGLALNEKMTETWHQQMDMLAKAAADGLGKTLGEPKKPSGVNKNVGISVRPDGGSSSIQPCATYPKETRCERETMNKVVGQILPQVLRRFLPKEAIEVAQATYDMNASFDSGHHDNIFSTSIQCNVSTPSADLKFKLIFCL